MLKSNLNPNIFNTITSIIKPVITVTIAAYEEKEVIQLGKEFKSLGFKIFATEGTHKLLTENGIDAEKILKLHEGRPNILDAIKNEEINLIINTPVGKKSMYDDSYIRKSAIKYKIPYITTISAALAATKGIAAQIANKTGVRSLQEYHSDIK